MLRLTRSNVLRKSTNTVSRRRYLGYTLKRLSDLNIYKSAGPDNLFPRILYEIRNQIAFQLLKIFELSLSANQIPDDCKNAIITPILKKGDKRAAKKI